MIYTMKEVHETIRMIESENLDIRTVTLGINLLDAPNRTNREAFCEFVYNRIYSRARQLVEFAQAVEDKYGIPIVNKRIAVTPIAVAGAAMQTPDDFVAVARVLDKVAEDCKVDYLGGYSALVHKGATQADLALLDSIPAALASTKRICSSINLGTTRDGLNLDCIRRMGGLILDLANKTPNALGCAKLVVFCNAVEDNPFIAGAFHGIGGGDAVLNVGVSGPGAVRAALERLKRSGNMNSISDIIETIKRVSFKITRAGELVGREVARMLGDPVRFGIVDLSLAPTPAIGDSISDILELMGLESTGCPGTTAALAMLVDAVKKGGAMAASQVGGLSGAFIPVSEDQGMIEATRRGSLTLEKLEAMTAVCSVGLDMVAVPGDTPPATLSGIIADELAIGMINNKTTAVRILPVPGSVAGDLIDLGGLLGTLAVMPVSRYSCHDFIALKGTIPGPIHSIRN